MHRREENHFLDRDCHHACISVFKRHTRTRQIHMRYHPAAENIAVHVRICGHCEHADGEVASGFFIGGCWHAISPTLLSSSYILPIAIISHEYQRATNN